MELSTHSSYIYIALVASIALAAVVIPVLKQIAPKLGLVDKPNARKVHTNAVPVIGGLGIGITLAVSLAINPFIIEILTEYYVIIGASLLLMLTGIFDDKLDLRASHRLIIQMFCAFGLAATGIRLTSLYGIFGIGELGIYASYAMTIVLVVGVVNAFNLIDGIDGLAGFLALIGLSIFGYQAFISGDMLLTTLLIPLIGGVFIFLTHNLGSSKIFLGDGGSLLLGFVLVATGIQLIESANQLHYIDTSSIISIVFGVFLIPVLDSLRVYWSRMNDGFSPFRADKRHIHHLFLFFKLSHKKSSVSIALSALAFIGILVFLYNVYGLSTAIVTISILFLMLTNILSSIKDLGDWSHQIKELENRI